MKDECGNNGAHAFEDFFLKIANYSKIRWLGLKWYEGYKDEIRDDPIDGKDGNIIRPADPVCGGYILNYIMEPGRRYQVGTSATSKVFGAMMLLIFSCGSYLRYKDICVITDSAYGVLEGMALMRL